MTGSLPTRTLGTDGPQVPVICFGAWPLGGGMGEVDARTGIRTVHAAIDAGVTFIDTAEMYRTSESTLGKALAGKRDQIFLASKLSGDHSREHIREAIENSLRQLGTDHLDLYQIHSPKPQWPIAETMAELVRLQEEGKIRHIGVSNFKAAETRKASMHGRIQSSQPHYSMLFREAERDPLPYCRENGIGVMAYSPIGRGLLTGKYAASHRFGKDDTRSSHPSLTHEVRAAAAEICARLEPFAKENGYTMAQLAIAWTLANPAVTAAICGAKTPEQAIENARAGEWRLTESEMAEIETLIEGFSPGV
ncbi:MAG: aldo/keto reductase [Chloroflexi bacterium]|nr:aldo/keto reductase [Chloroflexota bacterium]